MLVLSIIFAADFIAAVVCYLRPKIYESTGSFSWWATPDQSMPVAGAHAATAVSSQDLHLRWGIPFDDAVQRLKESVTIETTASETLIRARFESAQDARIVVESLMSNFPGFERGHQWSQAEGVEGRYTKKEEETEQQIRQLRKAMFHTLREAGHFIPGSLVSAATVERLGNEDLRRQFKAYLKLNDPPGRFAPADGKILIPPPIASPPNEARKAIAPDLESCLMIGRIIGLIVAIATLLAVFFRKPALIEAPARTSTKATKDPAWAEIVETKANDCLSW